MENEYRNRLERYKKTISDSEGLERASEIIDSLEYILLSNDEHIYPFIVYQQSYIDYWINKNKELISLYDNSIEVNSGLKKGFFFGCIISFSFNVIFIIYHFLKG
jgi:hypothetical protein